MAERVFTLPDLGEGLEEAIVSAWLVAEGDTVSLNQPFVEIETAKATVEVPAPFAGRVARLHVASGETLAVGAPLATFEVAGGERRRESPRRLFVSGGVRASRRGRRRRVAVVGSRPASPSPRRPRCGSWPRISGSTCRWSRGRVRAGG